MAKEPTGVDNFEFTLTKDLRAYYSSIDPTLAPPDVLVRGSQNVYKTANGTWANREGRKTYDYDDTTLAKVDAAFVWNNSLGKTYPVRIANSKFQVLSSVTGTKVWYDLMTSLSTTRGVWDSVWDGLDLKDKLVMVIGDLNIYTWSGGITTSLSGTNGTITKQGTTTWAQEGFAGVGTVTINGVDYTYTGGAGTTTLTGVTPDASALTAGLVSISKVITTAKTNAAGATDSMICDFIRVVGNRLHVGSYTSRQVGVSKNSPVTGATRTDHTNFTVPASRVAGDPELLTLDNAGKGIGVRLGNAHIFAGTSDLYIISYEDITVGTTLTQATKVDKKQLGNLSSAYAHEFIDVLADNIMFLGQDQQLHGYGTFRNINQSVAPVLSNEVSTDLFNEDFTLGQLKVILTDDRGALTYITAPNSGVTYIYQLKTGLNSLGNVVNEQLWFAPFVWGLSRIDSIGTDVIGFSNSTPQTYTLWDTGQWHDDSPSGFLAYTSVLLTSYRSHSRRQGKIRFDKIYWEGYMTQGTSLYGGVYFDYQGASGVLAPIIHSSIDNSSATNQSFFTGVVPPSLGDASLGDNPLGDTTAIIYFGTIIRDRDLLPKFRIITGVQPSDCFEYALMIYSIKPDDRWELIALGPNVYQSPSLPVEIIKQT